ncbi:MAG: NAD(P)-binding domain-containing protein [Pseudomonadota bacterium]
MQKTRYLIVGAGPAGVQMAYHMQQAGDDYLVVEKGPRPGYFFETFPRHRTLISINKRFTGSDHPDFNMRHDWNSLLSDDLAHSFTDYDENYFPNADSLTRYMADYCRKYELSVQYNTEITEVAAGDEGYLCRCADGREIRAEYLLIGTGLFKPLIPQIEGIEHAENYVDMSVDPSDFNNQRVLIIGKGNSGFETADNLVANASVIHVASPSSIRMAWKTHYVGHLRAVNNNLLDTYQLKSQNAVIDADIRCIEANGDNGYDVTFAYRHAQGEVEVLSYDRILCCAGFRIDDGIFTDSARPQLTIKNKYPLLSSEFESVNCPKMYFIGTLTHSLDYRKTTSGFIHGFRYNVKALHSILGTKHEGRELPEEDLYVSPLELSRHMLDRANVSGALWQQPGYMADYVYWSGSSIRYGTQLPIRYITEQLAGAQSTVCTMSLEYGDPIEGDPFAVERIHRENVEEARSSKFLHPVIRIFQGGELVDEHHVLEDLESRWEEPVHIDPLAQFLERYFTHPASVAVS